MMPCSPKDLMPPLLLSTLLLCRCRDVSLRDFGDSRSRKDRGMVLLLTLPVVVVPVLATAVLAVLVGVVAGFVAVLQLLLLGESTVIGGDFGPNPAGVGSCAVHELTVAVSRTDAFAVESGQIL